MKSSDFIIVLTTAPKREEAEALAAYIVSERLGACVQIKEIESFYLWQDELVSSKEFELSIKTLKKHYKKIKKAIAEISSYELPQIIVLPALQGGKEYLGWVKEGLR